MPTMVRMTLRVACFLQQSRLHLECLKELRTMTDSETQRHRTARIRNSGSEGARVSPGRSMSSPRVYRETRRRRSSGRAGRSQDIPSRQGCICCSEDTTGRSGAVAGGSYGISWLGFPADSWSACKPVQPSQLDVARLGVWHTPTGLVDSPVACLDRYRRGQEWRGSCMMTG